MEPNTAVLFVNSQQAKAARQGDLSLEVTTPSGTKTVLLLNVLHVPEATASLFSATQAMEDGFEVISRNNRCQVTRNGHSVMEGISQGDGLMVINQARQQPAVATAAKTADKKIYHRICSHRGGWSHELGQQASAYHGRSHLRSRIHGCSTSCDGGSMAEDTPLQFWDQSGSHEDLLVL